MTNKKYGVRVAWNREASDFMDENGWDELVAEDARLKAANKHSEFNFELVEFDTEAEMKAYIKGINDGNGWDEPMTEIAPEPLDHDRENWMYRDGANYKTCFNWGKTFDNPEPEIEVGDEFDMNDYSITAKELCEKLGLSYDEEFDHSFVTKEAE